MKGSLDLERFRRLQTSGTRVKHDIPGLLVAAARHGLEGRLLLKDESATRVIGYRAGRPVMVASNMVAERLGGRLLATSAITVEHAAAIDRVMERDKLQFGSALLKLGIMTR
ncbi:MAG: hypothetical protein AAB426_06175, partial [Myxococcota bacterium]